jgi:hypothetical protein
MKAEPGLKGAVRASGGDSQLFSKFSAYRQVHFSFGPHNGIIASRERLVPVKKETIAMKRKWDKWLKWKIGAVASLGVALLFHEVRASPQFAEAAAKSGGDSGGDKLATATAPGTDPFAEMQRQNADGDSGSLSSGTSGGEGRRGGKHGRGRRSFPPDSGGADSGPGSGFGGDLGSGSGGTFSRPSTPSGSDSGSGSIGTPTSPSKRTQTRTTRS